MTVEQFCQVLGYAFGFFVLSSFCVFWVFCFLNSFHNGWLYYKTVEYYSSFRYLNKRFKAINTANCKSAVKNEFLRTRNTIELLRYQHVIPKFLYLRLFDKAYEVSESRLLEVFENEEE